MSPTPDLDLRAAPRAAARLAAALVAAALLPGTPARAADAGPAGASAEPSPPAPRPTVSLTVSGGVSLGAYEGGFLYYQLGAAQLNPWLGDVRLATGASAGSVNALLALRGACAGVAASPDENLLAQVWLPVGFRQLFVKDDASALGAFSQASLVAVADRVEAELAKGLPERCDVVLGIAVTRVTPRARAIAEGRLAVPRTEEKFVLRIQGRGAGHMPRITNYVDPGYEGDQALLPEAADGTVAFPHVRDSLIASTAFPLAFPPRPVAHCVVQAKGRRPPLCPAAEATTALFIDGGVFDNTPLRLAATLAAAGLRPGAGGLDWTNRPNLAARRPPDGVYFGFLSADAAAYPASVPPSGGGTDSVPALLSQEVGTFVETARTRELGSLVNEFPHVAEGLIYPQRHFPAASEPMYAFFGFFERAFRSYDFALGMYEARRHLERFSLPALARRGPVPPVVMPEAAPGAREAAAAWRPFACMRAVFDGAGDPAALCAGDDLREFRIVMQVQLDRLWDLCRVPAEASLPPGAERACAAARSGAPIPRVPGVPAVAGALRRPAESDAVHAVRLLAAYGFDWQDMGFGRADAQTALTRLRRELGAVGHALARRQPELGDRAIVAGGGEILADAFYYLPPANVAWITFGRAVELGASASVQEQNWIRLGGALKFQNLILAISSDPQQVSLLPVIGGAIVPASLGSTFLQPSFLLRGGWNLSFANGANCSGSNGTTIGGCSRPEVEAGAALAFAGVVRLQLMVEWYPPALAAPGLWAFAPSLGFQLGF